jgi:hypothetical protein
MPVKSNVLKTGNHLGRALMMEIKTLPLLNLGSPRPEDFVEQRKKESRTWIIR